MILEISYCFLQALFQLYLRLPAIEFLHGQRNIRFPLLRVITRQWHVYNRGAGIGQINNLLCQLQHSEFTRIANVYRPNEVVACCHHAGHALNQIINILKTACLQTGTVMVISSLRRACIIKLDTTLPSFGFMRGP